MSYQNYANNLSNMGSQPMMNQGQPNMETPYMQQLRQRLEEAQKMQAQLQANPMMNVPGFQNPQQQINQMQVQPQNMQLPPVQQQAHQQPQISPEGQAVLALFEEFAKTDDGKQLVANMGKFNSFCQSQIAKAQNGSNDQS